MFDPVTLSTNALEIVATYLIDVGKDAAKATAQGMGKSLWDWIKGKLTTPAGVEAVGDLEAAPDEATNVKAVEAALAKVLKANSASGEELAKLLQSAGVSFASQTANSFGDNNKIGQASGGSTVTIG